MHKSRATLILFGAPNVFGSSIENFLDASLWARGILFDPRCLENLCIPGVLCTNYNLLYVVLFYRTCCPSLRAAINRACGRSDLRERSRHLREQDRHYRCTMEGHSGKRCCLGKAIGITYLECVFVALVIQKVKCLRRFMLSLARPFLPYFWTLSHKGHDFRGKGY